MGKLMELAEKDRNVLHLTADNGPGYDEVFKHQFPDQFFNFGIAEENMVSAAAGMASAGKIPFVFSAGAFLAYRALEFIRDDVCFQNLNVKIAGMGGGLSLSSLGPTHHATEDIAMLRVIPNLMLLIPATPLQAAECVRIAYEHQGPVYIRLGMNREKEFFDKDYVLRPERNDVIVDSGNDIVVYSTGGILEEAYKACEKLQEEGVGVKLMNVSCLKPVDPQSILEEIKAARMIFTVEEHSIYGGLGGLISEIVAYRGLGARVIPIGLKDVFASGYGTLDTVRKKNGLDAESIYNRIAEAGIL